MGHIIPDIDEPAIGQGAHEVRALIHTAAEAEEIFRSGGGVRAEERAALLPRGWFYPGQTEHGGGKIHKRHQPLRPAAGSIVRRGEVFTFVRNVNDQRHMQAGIEGPALAAGHAGAVIAIEKNNGVLRQPRVLQLLQLLARHGSPSL